MNRTGKRSAGNPHAPFDRAGAGNVAMGAGLRPAVKTADSPPDPNVGAPALDPTSFADFLDDPVVGNRLANHDVRDSYRKLP